MSQTEIHIGTLSPTYETLEDYVNKLPAIKRPTEDDTSWQSLEDWAADVLHGKIHIIDDYVWVVKDTSLDSDDDLYRSTKNPDGTITYVLKYYNGGCSWNEALEESLKRES